MIPAATVWVLVLMYPTLDVSLHFTNESACNAYLTAYSTYWGDGNCYGPNNTCGTCIEATDLAKK